MELLRTVFRGNPVLANVTVSAAPQHDPRRRTGVARILNHDHSVDDDSRARPARIPMGIGVSCLVAEIIWIKNCEIGAVTYFQ